MDPQQQQQQADGYAGSSDGSSSSQQQQQQQKPESEAAPATDKDKKEDGPPGTLRVRASRKRTKTGCLTCRKRRIKCGEERPTCNNCIKSKRVCEGYNQRVVFKDGMNGLLRPGSMAGGERRFAAQPYPNLQPALAPQPQYAHQNGEIIPRDTNLPAHIREHYARRESEPGYSQNHLNVTVPLGPLPLPSPHHPDGSFNGDFGGYQDSPREEHQQYASYYGQPTPTSATASSFNIQPNGPSSAPNSASLFGPRTPFTPTHPPHDFNTPPQSAFGPGPSNTSAGSPSTSCPFNPPLDSKYAMASQGNQSEYNNNMFDPSNTLPPTAESTGGMGGANPAQTPDDYAEFPLGPDEFAALSHETEIDYDQASEDDMDDDDDDDDGDYRFGTQEDGMIVIETSNGAGKNGGTTSTRQQLSQVLEPFSRHLDEHSRISFRSFLPEPGVLATYHPTLSSSPLMNPTTAKIFCHFVYVLGPSMSLFERYPPNPHIAFTPGAGLHGPQNVWSYTIPILSLAHPPLLHAILALSSLHISKLTKGPSHPSLLHYHIALRRLGKAIASDRHRAHVATLAATLMLAYYETMAAEHDKWSSHIHGAKQLLKEVDFDRVTKRVELLDEDEQLAAQNGGQGESQSPFAAPQQPSGASLLAMRKMRRQMISDDVDESLKSYLMGTKGRRGASGKGKKKESNAERPFSKKELEHLKLQADMFWWYAKMDCYQSLLSGCSLILDYVHWGQCPPRARIGTLGTTYGSSDHYFLLLGRLCDFQVRDLRRKRAVMKANGGQWIPPPEMGGPPRGHRRPPPPNGMPPQEPMQFGMIPPAAHPPRIPRAFAETGIHEEASQNMDGPLPDDEDLDAATADAELEWAEIEKAFMVLQESLGAEYQPLPIEYMPVHSTPFGPAIYYRTYSIASLQMLYNMAMLVLHRCHPSMPPVAMMATGIQTRVTAPFAVDIARIVAGLVPTDSSTQINPALGASLIEATMPMFFAAVQYAEPEQRDWTVKKLREINRLTGWATASRILLGCQRAWEKAAEMGRAPPYTRPPFEEEAELFNEYYNYHQAVRNEPKEAEAGGDGARFLWKMAGRRTVEASGILGERDDVDLGIGMGMGMGMM